jgi:hypothetical protein
VKVLQAQALEAKSSDLNAKDLRGLALTETQSLSKAFRFIISQ